MPPARPEAADVSRPFQCSPNSGGRVAVMACSPKVRYGGCSSIRTDAVSTVRFHPNHGTPLPVPLPVINGCTIRHGGRLSKQSPRLFRQIPLTGKKQSKACPKLSKTRKHFSETDEVGMMAFSPISSAIPDGGRPGHRSGGEHRRHSRGGPKADLTIKYM
jgi:hypothetical protein